MTVSEAREPDPLAIPDSIDTILKENPEASYDNALVAQGELLARYRDAAASVLGISVEDLHDLGPATVAERLEVQSRGEAA